MKRLVVYAVLFMFVLGPLAPLLQGQGIDLGEEEDGMSAAEFREYIYELIERIIEQYASTGPNVDNESDPRIVDYIFRKLELQQVTVHFQETSFQDCLDFLRDITGLNIVISARARDIVESEDIKVNLRLREIKLKSVLALMLEVSDELVYGVKYDVLYIGTKEDWLRSGQYLFIYSIHEIVYRPPDFPAPKIGLGDIVPWNNK
jgi:hypothetical protein